MLENIWDDQNLIKILKKGGVAVMPTDTLYGIVGKAENPATVERIYKIRKRAPEKPCIILIGNISELGKFNIVLSGEQKNKIKEYWPGPVSIVLDCPDEKFTYLHRGTKTLAFRLPMQADLRNLLLKTGPTIAPSANTEGLTPARNIQEAENYFGIEIDLYLNGGEITGKPSKVVRLYNDGDEYIIRK